MVFIKKVLNLGESFVKDSIILIFFILNKDVIVSVLLMVVW